MTGIDPILEGVDELFVAVSVKSFKWIAAFSCVWEAKTSCFAQSVWVLCRTREGGQEQTCLLKS